MAWIPMEWSQRALPPDAKSAADEIPHRLRMAGMVLRAVFIACMLVITVRVSMPQNETIWTAYDTAGDLVRLVLGLAVCSWIVMQLFRLPRDAQSYRTWFNFGLAAVPFALICLVAIW